MKQRKRLRYYEVRIDPVTYRECAFAAEKLGCSINNYISVSMHHFNRVNLWQPPDSFKPELLLEK